MQTGSVSSSNAFPVDKMPGFGMKRGGRHHRRPQSAETGSTPASQASTPVAAAGTAKPATTSATAAAASAPATVAAAQTDATPKAGAGRDRVMGDMNGDGKVDQSDVDAFVMALTDRKAYTEKYGADTYLNGDFSGKGSVSFEDVNAFRDLLSRGITA